MLLLRVLRRLPLPLTLALARPALSLYPRLRPAHARRLRARFAASPFRELDLKGYYRARLELMLRGLRAHGRELPPGSLGEVAGSGHYRAALASGRPVALLGLHLGVVELLHRVPPAGGRPFVIVTAPAFSPALTAYLARGREREGKRVAVNGAAAPGLRAVLRRNGVLALMADQYPGRAEDYLELWGGRLRVPYARRLLALLLREGAWLLPVSTRLERDGRSSFRFHAGWGGADAAPGALETRLARFLEEAVAAAPEQWNWSYPKIRPGLSQR